MRDVRTRRSRCRRPGPDRHPPSRTGRGAGRGRDRCRRRPPDRRPGAGDLPARAPAGPGERARPAGAGGLGPRRADHARGRGARRAGRRVRPDRRAASTGPRPPRPHRRTTPTPRRAGTRIPLKGVRGAVADKLSRSRREIPDATCWVDADATELMHARVRDERGRRAEDLPPRPARPDLHRRAGPLPGAQLDGRHGRPGDRPARRRAPRLRRADRARARRARGEGRAHAGRGVAERRVRPAHRGGPDRHAHPGANSPAGPSP